MTTSQAVSGAGLGSRLARLLGVDTGEAKPVAAVFSLNFAVSAAFVLVQTSAFGLFIEEFGSQALPYAYFSIAVLSSVIGFTYLRLSQRMAFEAGLGLNLGFLVLLLLTFWWGLRTPAASWFVLLLPFCYETLENLGTIVVWHVAGHTFHVRQAKRVFGLIVAGNWVAKIVLGVLIAALLALVAPSDTYLLAAVSLLFAWGILRFSATSRVSALSDPAPTRRAEPASNPGLGSALRHQYSRLIFAYTLLWWLSFFIIENLFFHQVESRLHSSGVLAIFLGRQLAVMGVIALVTTSLLTRRVAHRYGLRFGLLAMPAIVSASVVLLAIGASLGWGEQFLFWAATVTRTLNVALGFSISQAMGSLLFQPLVGPRRGATQTIAEGIVRSLAIGLAGLILLPFNTTLHVSTVGLAFVFLACAVPWFWSILALARRYPLQMSEALRKRALGELRTLVFDASAILQLRASLHHPRPGLALYALNQLEQLAGRSWSRILVEELPDLLVHPAAEVRIESLRRILDLRIRDALAIVRNASDAEEDSEVRSMQLRVLAAMRDPEARSRILTALESPELRLRGGVIIGLLSAGEDADAHRASEALSKLASSENPAHRLEACAILSDVQFSGADDLLVVLIRDKELHVQQAALRAARTHADARLIHVVLRACDDPGTARVAEGTLATYGVLALELLAAEVGVVRTAGAPRQRALSIIRVLGRIAQPASADLLRTMLTISEPDLRAEVLASLSRLRYREGSLAQIYEGVLRPELEHAALLSAAIEGLHGIRSPDALKILRGALAIAFRQTRGRILLLLSFVYDREAVLRAKVALEQQQHRLSPMALETIDAMLPSSLRPRLLPLLEPISHSERLARWRAAGMHVQAESAQTTLQSLIELGGEILHAPWTRMSAMYAAALAKEYSCRPALERVVLESHVGSAEMGRWALERLSSELVMKGGSPMLSLVEKVLILKSAPLFAETPDNVLAELAGLVHEVAFDTGQAIFSKGDEGDSLYIIVSGAVKVWDEEHLLNELGEGEAFGELALLDPETRLATVEAVEPTSLLQLDAPHFREILDSQPEVSAAIIRVITKYLRGQLQYAREADRKISRLESFGFFS